MKTAKVIPFKSSAVYVTGPAKIDHVSAKNRQFLVCLLYHNLIYTTATKSSSLLQNLMGFLLQLWKWDSALGTKDISENITWCNLRSHGRFSQARSHIVIIVTTL